MVKTHTFLNLQGIYVRVSTTFIALNNLLSKHVQQHLDFVNHLDHVAVYQACALTALVGDLIKSLQSLQKEHSKTLKRLVTNNIP